MVQTFKSGMCLPLLMILFTSLIHCDRSPKPEDSQSFDLTDPGKRIHVILRIEDSFYYNADFEKFLQLLVGDECKELDPVSLSRLMDDFVENKMLLKAAESKNITVSWEEQKQDLARIAKTSWPESETFSLTEDESKAFLERLILKKYIADLVKDIEVQEEEIHQYYEQNKREFLQPERRAVSQILLSSEQKAVEVLEKVKGAPLEIFRETAKEVSQGVEAVRGGEMGIFEMNQLPSEMEKIVFSLKEDEISRVVESAYGFHIFRLDKKLEPELEELVAVSGEIRLKLLDQKMKQLIRQNLEDMKEGMDWEFYPQNLSFPYQRNAYDSNI
jgi:hypothetical protein